MDDAFEILGRVQRDIGGGIVYLECEDRPKLLGFYQNDKNRFKIFGGEVFGCGSDKVRSIVEIVLSSRVDIL